MNKIYLVNIFTDVSSCSEVVTQMTTAVVSAKVVIAKFVVVFQFEVGVLNDLVLDLLAYSVLWETMTS